MPRIPLRTTLLGSQGGAIERLFSDIAGELGYAAVLVPDGEVPALVFVMIQPDELTTLMEAARARAAGRAPIIALFALTDERVARRALELGASTGYALDTPLDRLREAIKWALSDRRERGWAHFSLGPRARLQIAVAREAAAALPTPPYWLRDDTFQRVEHAIKVDLAAGAPREPFRLGVHARLETTLMRLSASAVEALENAIDADLRDGNLLDGADRRPSEPR